VQTEIESLLLKGAIAQVSREELQVICPLFIVSKEGKNRPVHNLKPLNRFLACPHFKLESLSKVFPLIQPGSFFVKIDLADAYLSVPIKESDYRFLGFSWKGKYYHWKSLPFGLNQAPWAFTKLLRPVAAFFRALGISLMIYLDDLLLLALKAQKLIIQTKFVIQVLEALGFIVNRNKSSLIPATSIIYLGFLLDSVAMQIKVPKEKMVKLQQTVRSTLEKSQVSVRDLSRIIGRLNSLSAAVVPGHLHSRRLETIQKLNLRNQGYEGTVEVNQDVKKELLWWLENLPQFNGRSLAPPTPSIIIKTDSSLFKWGAVSEEVMISYDWPASDTSHINVKELKAAVLAFNAFVPRRFLKETTVQLVMDNCCAVHVINNLGSTRNEELTELASELWHQAIGKNVFLKASYLPGKENVEADWASRFFEDGSDWQLDPRIFGKINELWGPLDIDLFANHNNHQLEKFFSWFPDPRSMAVDAFTQIWPTNGAYAFPPFTVISKVLNFVSQQKINLVLIAPCWPQQTWFPTLLGQLAAAPRVLPASLQLLRHVRGRCHPLLRKGNLHLVAWAISGCQQRRASYLQQLEHWSVTPLEPQLADHINIVGGDGFIGVVHNKKIQMIPL
jgi:hypothetical protein